VQFDAHPPHRVATIWCREFRATLSTGASGALGSHDPVVLTLDFGEARRLQRVEILWEFPAKSFSISLSTDGMSWTEVYATDLNSLMTSSVNLGHQPARKLRLTMREVYCHHTCRLFVGVFGPWALQAHPTRGLYLGHSTFGVKSLKAFSAASGLTVEDCGSSKSSDDVSDKWFFVAAGEHDSCSSRTLRAELPQFEAAKASLAATIGELDVALPNMMLCEPSLMAGAFARVGVGSAQCSLPPRGAAGD
jgi:hypothetical protein